MRRQRYEKGRKTTKLLSPQSGEKSLPGTSEGEVASLFARACEFFQKKKVGLKPTEKKINRRCDGVRNPWSWLCAISRDPTLH